MAEEPRVPSPAANAEPAPQAPAGRGRRVLRRLLLVLGPALVAVAGMYAYLASGRYASTDNAYVKADIVLITPEVAGPIVRVDVGENERVGAGQVLFVIDDESYRVALTRAKAQLRGVESFVESLKAQYRQRLEELELARTDLQFTERELARETALAERELGSGAEVDRAKHEYDVAARKISIVEQQLAQLRAQLGGDAGARLEEQAAYQAVQAAYEQAMLDLERTVVRAPFEGVASKVPMLGEYAAPGGAVMSVVADHDVWVEANFKETDLTHVRVGQPVVVRVDTFPDREWRGEVASISQATGSEFAVIPAQNATGNWVKVTQRIPVRIAVSDAGRQSELRAGMSAVVEIDTGRERRLSDVLTFLRPGDGGAAHAAEPR
jgi:membrane fusion protein (multidrug efflux system)